MWTERLSRDVSSFTNTALRVLLKGENSRLALWRTPPPSIVDHVPCVIHVLEPFSSYSLMGNDRSLQLCTVVVQTVCHFFLEVCTHISKGNVDIVWTKYFYSIFNGRANQFDFFFFTYVRKEIQGFSNGTRGYLPLASTHLQTTLHKAIDMHKITTGDLVSQVKVMFILLILLWETRCVCNYHEAQDSREKTNHVAFLEKRCDNTKPWRYDLVR